MYFGKKELYITINLSEQIRANQSKSDKIRRNQSKSNKIRVNQTKSEQIKEVRCDNFEKNRSAYSCVP